MYWEKLKPLLKKLLFPANHFPGRQLYRPTKGSVALLFRFIQNMYPKLLYTTTALTFGNYSIFTLPVPKI
jgi:hypothetical protein